MHIDKQMEDYFRNCLAQGISAHVCEVALTVDNQIALRMTPVKGPTQEQIAAMEDLKRRMIREKAQEDLAQYSQQTDKVFAPAVLERYKQAQQQRKTIEENSGYVSPTAEFM